MGSRGGHPTTRVAALCIAAFFAGSFLHLPGLPEAGRGPTIRRDRKILSEENANSALLARNPDVRAFLIQQPAPRNYSTFEELVDASGMLIDRPPVDHGESGHGFYTVQPMQLLSWYPRAYVFPKFLDEERCKHVIRLAEAKLAPSGLALKKGDTLESTREIRTSQGTFMSRQDDPKGVLAYIEDKIAVLTGIPAGHGEAFNILRYELGQHYDSHYDAFAEEEYGKQTSQRVATVLVYLTNVEEGGETSFLFEGKNGLERLKTVDYKACDTGIRYKPRAGDALLFWSANPDGSLDKHSLHGGCPVIEGTKWTMTKWIRNKCAARGTCVGAEADMYG